ncbi:MAG: endonuclease [Cytophagaceae bacterium]|jgi:endonuclease I|nr:endonuclease [Cytophagaceae bacterium]
MKKLYSSILFLLLFLSTVVAQNPNGYYNSVSGKKKDALKTALHQIVRNHTRLEYGSLWNVFSQTDKRADGSVWDMYSNIVRYYPSTSGLNREHSLPKSWWGGNENAAYTDINHLYPSDAAANTAKSNLPLGVAGSNTSFNNGVSKVGRNTFPGYTGNVFEPADEYKGDFARTYFYMVTCYQDFTWKYLYMIDNNIYPVLNEWAVNMLLQWHRNDPVSQKEQERNEAVFRIQNNRNPFIDYPILAEHIWGNKMNDAFVLNTVIEDPVLITPTNNTILEFGTVVAGMSRTMELNVRGTNLTGQYLTAVLYGANSNVFSINATRIPVAAANTQEGYNLKVIYLPKEIAESHTASIIIYDGGISGSVMVNISGKSIATGSVVPPFALPATNITATGFKANWEETVGTESYTLEVWTVNNGVAEIVLSQDEILGNSFEVKEIATNVEYSYQVRRWANGMLSEPSNTVQVYVTTDIESQKAVPNILVYQKDNTIVVRNNNHQTEKVEIYNLLGKRLYTSNVKPNASIAVPMTKGIYIVKSLGEVRKVVLK